MTGTMAERHHATVQNVQEISTQTRHIKKPIYTLSYPIYQESWMLKHSSTSKERQL